MRWGRLYRQTPAELALEDAIAELGVVYRPQFPGFLYGVRSFPDFYLPTLKLVIEVDDPSHNRAEKKIEDEERTRVLHREWGVRVVRCTNRNALEDPRGVLRAMLSSVGLWPLPSRRPPVAGALPFPKKAPKKGRREAVASATRARRRRSPERPRRADHQVPDTRMTCELESLHQSTEAAAQ